MIRMAISFVRIFQVFSLHPQMYIRTQQTPLMQLQCMLTQLSFIPFDNRRIPRFSRHDTYDSKFWKPWYRIDRNQGHVL